MKVLLISICTLLILAATYAAVNFFLMRTVKTPNYTVLKKHKNIEIRSYSPMIVAYVTVIGNRKEAANKGFRLLADYIFGNNQSSASKKEKIDMTAPVLQAASKKIAMTAPVIQTPTEETDAPTTQPQASNLTKSWVIKFVMPKEYSLKTLPKPNNEKISIQMLPAKKVIAITFSGTSSQDNLDNHMRALRSFIKKNSIATNGDYEYAFYNPPWTLPFMRRNEILIGVNTQPH